MNEFTERFQNIQENISLKEFTTFKIGGNARYFLTSDDIDEIRNVIKFCNENNIKFKVIGWGSNLLVGDDGFDGLILKIINKNINFSDGIFHIGAGIMLRKFIEFAIEKEFIGHEFLAGIPGTIGGAIYGNAGGYGKDISNIVESVEIIDNNCNIKILEKKDCDFDYRDSVFKKNNFIIFSAKIKLEKGDIEKSKRLIEDRIKEKLEKQPKNFSAGSFFKNIELNDDIRKKLNKLDISKFEQSGKIPAGFLIDSVKLKGHCIKDACVSEIHGNFLINKGNAKAKDVLKLSEYIKKQVKKKYKIELEEEVQSI